MKNLCVIGDPVDHSLSPVMHNTAIGILGLEKEYTYAALRIPPSELGGFIGSMRKGSIAGASVTMPHKEAIIPFLDEVSETARKCRAVNTVVFHNDKIAGHNTDGEGCVKALKGADADPEDKTIALIGAGGAAKAIAQALCDNHIQKLYIINRTEARAETLAESLGNELTIRAGGQDLITEAMGDADIVINATSVGMCGVLVGRSPVPAEDITGDMTVMDIVYNPLETRLLSDARMAGARTVDGLGMLVNQGAIQFELFTGAVAPVGVMMNAVRECLEDD